VRPWRCALLGATGLGLAAALGACSSESETVTCPRSAIMPDLQAVVRFKPGAGRADTDAAYGVRLLTVPMACHFEKKDKSLDIAGKLGISAIRTDTLTKDAQVDYFVAIVNRSDTIIGKREFTLDLKWSGDQRRIEITDELHLVIPLAAGTSGADYAILLGFQLTPEELEYNRAHLKLPGSG